MFRITDGRGFHVTFDNGVILSTQFGRGNYCNNRMIEWEAKNIECKNAEIAIWDKDGNWITQDMFNDLNIENSGDDVLGYVNVNKWFDILEWCKKREA